MALTESFWPTPSQELLLVTALAGDERATAAWRALRPRFDLDRLEPGSFTLLPLVYRVLAAAEPGEPLLPRLKGIYRSIWAKNTLLIERTAETFGAFADRDVPALALGGLPLALRYYADLGLRRTQSTVALVDPADAAAAAAALGAARWFPRLDIAASSTALDGRPGYFGDRDGNIFVLLTSLGFDFAPGSEPSDTFQRSLADADGQDVGTARILLPSPADTLLALCVSGARVGPLPSMQWLVDAAMVIRSSTATLDWERFVDLGLEGRQVLRLRDTLEQLVGLPDVPVPAAVIDRFARAHTNRRDRLIYAGSGHRSRRLGALPLLLAGHLVASGDVAGTTTIAWFPAYLRDRWDLGSAWDVPLAAGRRALRALGGRNRPT